MKLITGICVLGLASASAQAELYGSAIKEAPEVTTQPASAIKVVPRAGATAPVARSAEPSPVAAPEESFTLRKGESIKSELENWAQRSGWEVIWNLADTWLIPNGITYYGDFKTAATTVIQTLAENGIVIRCIANEANKTMLIVGAGVQEQ